MKYTKKVKSYSKGLGILYSKLVAPKSTDKNLIRREYVLNTLLVWMILLSLLATLAAFLSERISSSPQGSGSEVMILAGLFLSGYILSKLGWAKYVSIFFIAVFILSTSHTIYKYGVGVPMALLSYALAIIMAGVLISSRLSLYLSLLVVGFLALMETLQNSHLTSPDLSWRQTPPDTLDVMVYGVSIFLISLLSWLFNKEMEKALSRARSSEKALLLQKENLEKIVEERTRELKESQIETITHLHRFAEFGKNASGLIHDLAGPVNLVSLNVNRLTKSNMPELQTAVSRALVGVKRLEGFVEGARKQIQNQDTKSKFSVADEISQTLLLLENRSQSAGVELSFNYQQDIFLTGNIIKFNQLMVNLISNAVDAYSGSRKKERMVDISMEKVKGKLVIKVSDQGVGVPKENLDKIFEPLFTTKRLDKGSGMGLYIVKSVVEKEFKGSVKVESENSLGTVFEVTIPL